MSLRRRWADAFEKGRASCDCDGGPQLYGPRHPQQSRLSDDRRRAFARRLFTPAPRRAVRLWLWRWGADLRRRWVVGGATRLTESGLSIRGRKPVTGAVRRSTLPAAGRVREIPGDPAIRERNAGMSLDAFKTIYWWEWSRPLARGSSVAHSCCRSCGPCRDGSSRACGRGCDDIRLGRRSARSAGGCLVRAVGSLQRVAISAAFHLTCLRHLRRHAWTAQIWRARRARRPTPLRVRAGALALLVLSWAIYWAPWSPACARASSHSWPLIDGSFGPDAAPCSSTRRGGAISSRTRSQCSSTPHGRLCAVARAVLHAADVARTLRAGPLTRRLHLPRDQLQADWHRHAAPPGAARLGLDASGHGDGRAHNSVCIAQGGFAPIFRPAPMR